MKIYCVYILTTQNNTVLYTGVSGDLRNRIQQHKEKMIEGFTKKYNCTKLVWYECGENPEGAIQREKQIKAGSRRSKVELIESMNPEWKDLSGEIS